MKVLLTGATGFLGSEIARQLVREGHGVRVLVRKTSKLDALAGLPVETFEGDIVDAASVERALEGVDALIHTAGNTSHKARDRELVRRTNIEGTRTVLGAALRRGGLRVVHTSSIAAVGATDEPVLQGEDASWALGGDGYYYGESKREAEDVALELARQGLDVVVLNPGMILGPGDVTLSSTKYVLEYMIGRNRFYPRGGNSFCDVRDVARAHVAALTRGRAGERYIVAGQNFTFRETLDELTRITGLGRAYSVPQAVLFLISLVLDAASRIRRHGLEELNPAIARLARKFFFVDVSKARRELGYTVTPFEETLRDTVKDHLARGLVEAKTPELRALAGAPAGEAVAALSAAS
jgi:dihydroflavonol-4-reductase